MKCVIVGNGKSLTVEQLDQLTGVTSIACNRINLIYPYTRWRPSVYLHPESTAPDLPYIRENVEMGIECWLGEHYGLPPKGIMDLEDAPNIHWIKECHHWLHNFDSEEIPDEWHFPQLCSFGGSVNMAMQLAAMRGFDELILIGCDLAYRNGNRSHFSPLYENGGERPPFQSARNALFGHIQALNTIRRKKLDLRVYNATRGGTLDIWERRTLEECL